MMKVINVTDIQNGKQALLLFTFRIQYLHLSLCLSLFRFLLSKDKYLLLIAADIDR